MALVESYTDDFDNLTGWTANATSIVSGQAVMTCGTFGGGTVGELRSSTGRDLTASSFIIRLVQAPNKGNGATVLKLILAAGSPFNGDANSLSFQVATSGSVQQLQMHDVAANSDSSTAVTYSATNHQWLRIRESGGNILWDTSPHGASLTWTNVRTKATDITITGLCFMFQCFDWSASEPNPGTTVLDKLNLPPSAVAHNAASDFFSLLYPT